jgi:hypothetical protein
VEADFKIVASNSTGQGPAEVAAELEVIMAKSEYSLGVCLKFTTPIAEMAS